MSIPETPAPKNKKRMIWISAFCFIIVIIAVLTFFYWLFVWRHEVYTTDAYVSGNLVNLNSQVSGIVSSINIIDTDYVEKGQILVELDTTDLTLTFETNCQMLAGNIRLYPL